MKKIKKLRTLIFIATMLIATVIVTIFGSVSIKQYENILMERTLDDYQDTSNALQKNIETLILYVEDFAKYMSLNEDLVNTLLEYPYLSEQNGILEQMAMKKKWDEISKQLIFSTSMMYSMEFYSGNTMVYSYYDDPLKNNQKNLSDDILEQAYRQAAPVLSDLLTLRQMRSYVKKDEYGFAVVKSVVDENGQKIGLLAIFVRESSFADILQSVNDEIQKSYACLVDKAGHIISAVDKTQLYCEVTDVLELSEEEYQICVEKGMLLKEEKGQTPVLYINRSVGNDGIKLLCATTMSELKSQQKKMKVFTGGMMALVVVCAMISAWFVSRRITKPLGELMGIMESIKTEEKNIHLRFPEGDSGEIGILGKRFNELMDELDMSMQQIYDEQRQRRHNEVRLLQAQIVPHFLYNTMGIISSFIKLGMDDKALETIQNLVNFYRYSLSSGKDIIRLTEEIELTKNYIELQQLRYIEYMEYSIECIPEAKDIWIPKLTIQPLVENVLHHGLKLDGEKCQIRIRVVFDETKEYLKIIVYDNGSGMTKERLEQLRQSLEKGESITKSFGVLNIDQRLKLIYKDQYHMEIDSIEGEYTQFMLYLPLENNDVGEKDV